MALDWGDSIPVELPNKTFGIILEMSSDDFVDFWWSCLLKISIPSLPSSYANVIALGKPKFKSQIISRHYDVEA
jgi:hypothetical protein